MTLISFSFICKNNFLCRISLIFLHILKKSCTFAEEMITGRLHRLFASVIFMAFCIMMAVKTFHHHHHCCCCHNEAEHSVCCVLDGEPLDGHHLHHHDSFLPDIEQEDDDCAICHFQVVKVPRPSFASFHAPIEIAHKIETFLIVSVHSDYFSYSLSRAPPVG